MPLPEDDDHICFFIKNGKTEFATVLDRVKFFKLVGETIFESLDKEKLEDESCEDCGFRDCVCDPEDDSF